MIDVDIDVITVITKDIGQRDLITEILLNEKDESHQAFYRNVKQQQGLLINLTSG